MKRILSSRLVVPFVLLAAACATNPSQPGHALSRHVGAISGEFCWSRYPLLQADKSCAPPDEAALAQEACTRTALEALTHPYAANRDWVGLCMARHGLTRLEQEK